ncbi:MAG TPA: arginine deiminase family protein [Longimicrobium sp.]|jgi:dimethylargininase
MRRIPDTYASLYAEHTPISLELARAQHDAYADALRRAGVQVRYVPPDPAFPDSVFVEDPAVVWPPRALLGRMAQHREGEQRAVVDALSEWCYEVVELPPGALLEGGDVLHVGNVTYVGLTGRTNRRGCAALAEFMQPAGRRVVGVQVREDCLHLKSVATYLGNGTLVAAPDLVDPLAFEVEEVLPLTDELGAANCLRVNGHLLFPAGYPNAELRLREFAAEHGVEPVRLDISEFEKGEGSLTCLCIIW